jgi:hypothetical protein
VLVAGDFVYFKRGVTYQGGQITCASSGAVKASGSNGTITAGGVFASSGAGFLTAGVTAGLDWLYVYHNKQAVTGTWVEACGLYAVASVDSETQLTLGSSPARAWATAELPYFVIRPITYKAAVGWGTGDATLSGGSSLSVIISTGDKSSLRFEGLSFTATASSGNYYRAALCHLANGSDHVHVVNCTFSSCGDSGLYLGGKYVYASGCVATSCAAYGVRLAGESSHYEHNETHDGCRGGAQGGRWAIIRYSKFYNHVTSYNGYHSDSIGYIDGGSSSYNSFGWIYGCLVDNFIEAMALYGTGGGMTNWVIHSNVVVSRRSQTGYGDGSVMLQGCRYMYFFNNTFVGYNDGVLGGIGSNCFYVEDHVAGADATDNSYLVFRNNIVYATGGNAIRLDANQAVGADINRNHYCITGDSTPFLYALAEESLAQWQALGFDTEGFHSTHGLATDPAFTDFTNLDLTLSSSSPDIGIGEDLSAYFTLDRAGRPRTVTAWDLGAYGYSSGSSGGTEEPSETGDCLVLSIGGGVLAFRVATGG